jgi:hypothetical protein
MSSGRSGGAACSQRLVLDQACPVQLLNASPN